MKTSHRVDSEPHRRILNSALAGLLYLVASLAHAAQSDVIVTDRPDFVESSAVVGHARFQVETGIVVERNRVDGSKERTITTPTLLRIGAGQDWELRLETDGRTVFRTEQIATGAKQTLRGYSDLSVGVKWHATDGSGSAPSMALLGHVEVDSGTAPFRGNGLRPSLRVVAEWELPNDLSLGLMPGLVYDRSDQGERFVGAIFGIVLGKTWSDRFRTFVEIAAPQIARARDGGTIATLDVGAAYLLSNRWQIDTALSQGLNKNTADLAWGFGLSAKF